MYTTSISSLLQKSNMYRSVGAIESSSQCSVTCGGGLKNLTFTCVDPNTGKNFNS